MEVLMVRIWLGPAALIIGCTGKPALDDSDSVSDFVKPGIGDTDTDADTDTDTGTDTDTDTDTDSDINTDTSRNTDT